MPTKTLPDPMTVKDARATSVTTCLSVEERRMFDALVRNGRVFGSLVKGDEEDNAVVTVGKTDEVVAGGCVTARAMRRAGWFRFAKGPTGSCGYFWLTDAAERVAKYGKP